MEYALVMYGRLSNTRVNASSTQTFQLFYVPIDVRTAPENFEKSFSAPEATSTHSTLLVLTLNTYEAIE